MRCVRRVAASQRRLRASVLILSRSFSRIDGYLHYYGKCKNQEGMLKDTPRVEGYRLALEAASSKLQGATVMDIGTGSGILAMLAAKQGAKKVYAIEGSPEIARVASRLARANGLGGVVEVVPKLLEDVTSEDIPDGSVDVVISELMSHFLVGELGPQAVTYAKRRFLRPGGLVLPAAGTLKLAPFSEANLGAELRARHAFWNQSDFFGLNLKPALQLAIEQQFRELVIDSVDPAELIFPPSEAPSYFLDLAAPDDPAVWSKISFELQLPRRQKEAVIDGVAGWWDVIFEGAGDGPAPVLSTAPDAPHTVWAQCRFMLEKPMAATPTANLSIWCDLKLDKIRESYSATLELRNHSTGEVGKMGPVRLSDVYARQFQPAQNRVHSQF